MNDMKKNDGMDLFDHLRAANRARQEVWPGGDKADGPFRTIEFGEESGELLGAVKKLMRFQRGIAGNVGKSEADLIQSVREEIGDVLISLDLMVDFLDIDLRECVPMKFNMTSAKVGVNCYMDSNWGWGTLDDEVQDELFPR